MEGKTIAMGSTVELKVPAVKEMMLVVRLTTAAVMARIGISADKMDDMKMAVEEAANCLIQTSSASELNLSFIRVPQGISIHLSGLNGDNTDVQKRAVSEDELSVIRCILETMADDVAIDHENGCIGAIELQSFKTEENE